MVLIRMRPLITFLLLSAMVLVFGGCASTPVGFPKGKYGPTAKSTTTPSACLEHGKTAQDAGDWATAYRWYARGGGWNTQGRSTGFPSPGTLSEPEETQRFKCILAFLEATRHLIAQGVRVDADGVHPLYVSITEANQSIGYFRNAHPQGYAGLSAADMKALVKGTDAAGPVRASRDVTMDSLEQVDRGPSSLQVFQRTVAATSVKPADRPGATGQVAASPTRESLNMKQAPPIVVPTEKHGTHAEAARLYREAAAKYPEDDARRQEMLKLAAEEDRAAAAESGNSKPAPGNPK